MRTIFAILILAFATGCTITSKQPDEQLYAENAAMKKILDTNARVTQGRDADRAEITQMLNLLGLWRNEQARQVQQTGGCGNPNGCWQQQPVIQPMPQQPIYQPQPSPQPIIVMPGQPVSTQPVAPPQQPIIVLPSPNPPSVQPVPEAPVSIQPVPQNPMIQPVPPAQYCMWTCDQISGRCGYSCTTSGGPIVYPTQPPPNQPNESPEVENPHFHDNKG